MSPKLKLAAYAVMIMLTAWFGHKLYAGYHEDSGSMAQTTAPKKKKRATNAPPVLAATNAVSLDTNVAAATTNATDLATNAASNIVAQASPPDSNQTAAANTATTSIDQDPTTMAGTITGSHQGKTVANLALFVVSAVGLGLLVAIDVTSVIGEKAGDYLFNDRGEAERDPEYEKAEQVWANGKHLEAIQMLRDYYKANPRQVHAALRIAEIYEKDLRNYLAAALEYEEVLKKKLPSDRWGWAAIHLCNLYSRLGQQDKTMGLLRRIAEEHPKCAAAKKARQKLGLPEPEVAEEAPAASGEEAAVENDEEVKTFEVSEENSEWPAEAGAETPQAEEPKSNLPPGFRKKK